jgi:hypothetical protein
MDSDQPARDLLLHHEWLPWQMTPDGEEWHRSGQVVILPPAASVEDAARLLGVRSPRTLRPRRPAAAREQREAGHESRHARPSGSGLLAAVVRLARLHGQVVGESDGAVYVILDSGSVVRIADHVRTRWQRAAYMDRTRPDVTILLASPDTMADLPSSNDRGWTQPDVLLAHRSGSRRTTTARLLRNTLAGALRAGRR